MGVGGWGKETLAQLSQTRALLSSPTWHQAATPQVLADNRYTVKYQSTRRERSGIQGARGGGSVASL